MRKITIGIILFVLIATLTSSILLNQTSLELARKVNEYEGQHLTNDGGELVKVNEYEGQHLKVNEYEGQHR